MVFRTSWTWPRTKALYCHPCPSPTGRRTPSCSNGWTCDRVCAAAPRSTSSSIGAGKTGPRSCSPPPGGATWCSGNPPAPASSPAPTCAPPPPAPLNVKLSAGGQRRGCEVGTASLRRPALGIIGSGQGESLVAAGGDLVALRGVGGEASGVGHEYARLARDVGAQVPGAGGHR